MPRLSGNGLAMRAAAVLAALARSFEVHLFVVPVAGDASTPDEFVRRNATRIGGLDLPKHIDPLFALIARIIDPEARRHAERAYPKPFLSRFCTGESARILCDWNAECPASAIHVMRLYLAPLVQGFLHGPAAAARPLCVLDLDEDDGRTCDRIARLYAAAGEIQAAQSIASEAAKYRAFAERFVPAFDRVTLCSEPDADRLREVIPAAHDVAVVPNSVEVSGPVVRPRSSDGPLRLLFVGTFGYFPNLDAALFLCREVLPALRRKADREIVLELAGSGCSGPLIEAARAGGAILHGYVDDLAPLYRTADVAIVPVRAGGGTRIKILEAFAYGVPVVATRLGAEGIDAVDGEHLLQADDPEGLAENCLRVKQHPELAAALSRRAAAFCAARHSPAQVEAAIAEIYIDLTRRNS